MGWLAGLSLSALNTNFTLTYHYKHLPSLHEGHVDNCMMLMLHETYAPVLQARNGKTLLMHCAAYAHIREESKAQLSC